MLREKRDIQPWVALVGMDGWIFSNKGWVAPANATPHRSLLAEERTKNRKGKEKKEKKKKEKKKKEKDERKRETCDSLIFDIVYLLK